MRRLTTTLTIALLALTAIGCNTGGGMSSGSSTDTSVVTAVVPNPWTGTGTAGNNLGSSGGSAQLITSAALMQMYSGHPVASADDVTVTVQLDNFEDSDFVGNYSGYLTISYNNGGEYMQGVMWTGDTTTDTQYNIWYNDPTTGKRIFHGIFEDEPPSYPGTQTAGGIILVIDNAESLGDGALDGTVSGSVWFKNYGITTASKPETKCWFIQLGPYDCQSWPNNASAYSPGIDPKRSIYPDSGYIKLGTFSGLNATDAFNIQ
jgi:hypothetical protein